MKQQDFDRLLADLAAEEDDLDALVAPLDASGWAASTPAEGWNVMDQIAHLASTGEWASVALTDTDAFRADLDELAADSATRAAEVRTGLLGRRAPSTNGAGVLEWWRDARRAAGEAFRARDPADRVPWFGPDMSAASLATARLMETWAHGQDVADALQVDRVPTVRLRHVAEIGVRTRPFAYASREMTLPDEDVRIELRAPDGSAWTWGPPDSPSLVRGPAVDWCLVVTQRRNPDDTALEVTGDAAQEWVGIAQAFAGAPTPHRPPLHTSM
jgi:uncharacterized protein (TIGR03084 family)